MKFPSSKRTAFIAVLVLAAALAPARAALAQEAATLAAAEKAYAEVDFERTRTSARAALEQGGHEPAETKRLYALLGIASAALKREDDAREAFRRVLAIDPDSRLDQGLSPKMRAPYLEARGALSAAGELRPLAATLTRSGDAFSVELYDVAGIAETLELELAPPDGAKRTLSFPPRPATPIGDASRLPETFDYVLSVRDQHKNRLFRGSGRIAAPVKPETASSVLAQAERPAEHDAGPPNRTPYLVTAGVLATLGLGAVAGGIVAQVQREDAAKEWNSASCEVPGPTRGEQCADVEERRKTAEHWAIGLYVTGGAFLVGSLVTLAVMPAARSTSLALGSRGWCAPSLGPDRIAGVCRLRF